MPLTEGTEVPRHHHHNEQISYILEGATQIYFGPHDEQTHIVRAGEAVVTPSNLPHCAVALEDTVDVDVSRHQGTTGCTEPTPICAANDNAADHGAGDKP